MEYTLESANNYIENNSKNVNETFRQDFHVMSPVGWINDPNGFVFFNDKYHLFYQYYPYDSKHGPMHWGHVISNDLVTWEHLPVALAPDTNYDKNGCFSGSAIEKDGLLYVMYTGNLEDEKFENNRQVQCMAVSEDGINFSKIKENPVLNENDLPDNAMIQDFRDPKILKKNGVYYSVIASRTKDERGQVLLYESSDLVEWKFKSILLEGKIDQGVMWECPDLFELDGEDVLILSPIRINRKGNDFHNISSSVVFIGKVDWETGEYHVTSMDEIDHGMDFYAPQTMVDSEGRRIMVAWMQMWDRPMITHLENHGWAGSMTLPRELKIENGQLIQKPIRELASYEKDKIILEDITVENNEQEIDQVDGEVFALHLNLNLKNAEKFEIKLRKNVNEETSITYYTEKEELELDRGNSGFEIIGVENIPVLSRIVDCPLKDNKLKLDIYVDKSSIEIFAQDGVETITSTIYPLKIAEGISFKSFGTTIIESIEKSSLHNTIISDKTPRTELGVQI